MAEDALKIWETLFQRALALIDSASVSGAVLTDWSFGSGTVLMRRYHHRLSKDIDIFIPDRQYLNYLTPRLNDEAEALTTDYVEDERSLKLRFTEGEIDFTSGIGVELAEVITVLTPAGVNRSSLSRLAPWRSRPRDGVRHVLLGQVEDSELRAHCV